MKKDYQKGVQAQNKRGEYVPAIPIPYYGFPFMQRKVCECGEKFWRYRSYEAHYALEHILGF